ncbi:MAG: rod shape-determining protein MreC [Rikenellaceae bacterium]|nr:rod shape-determining protein MreC [Rikenellaceae bacterium]
MNRLIDFIGKIYVPLLFIVIEIVALNYYASSTSYTRAKMLTASNHVTDGFHRYLSDIGDYFRLRSENDLLLEELAAVRNELEALRMAVPDHTAGQFDYTDGGEYSYMVASVINNSVTRQKNYLIIDKGERDGVRINMALVTPDHRIVGYVLDCSENFSVAISVLNRDFRTGAKATDDGYFGSLYWDGVSPDYVTLSEIHKNAVIAAGDTIVTGYSSIFPPDVLVGTVEDMHLTQSNYYEAKVKLSTSMTRLGKLFVVNYADIQERILLEEGLFD